MTNYRAAEDFAYELVYDNPGIEADEVADKLIANFGVSADDAYDIAAEAVEDYEADHYLDGDWCSEMGFDPYEGCYSWDC